MAEDAVNDPWVYNAGEDLRGFAVRSGMFPFGIGVRLCTLQKSRYSRPDPILYSFAL